MNYLLIGAVIFIGVLVFLWVVIRRREDEPQRRPYAKQMEQRDKLIAAQEEAALMKVAAEPEESTKDRSTLLLRGTDRTPVIFSYIVYEYDFAYYLESPGGNLVLVDQRFPTLANRRVVYPLSKVSPMTASEFTKLMRAARTNVNKRAQTAGLLAIKHRKVAVV